MMRRLMAILACLLALLLQAQSLKFHQLTVKDGLPHNCVISLGEDRQGNIWVSTLGGISIYDGERFSLLSDDHLPDHRVDRIYRDRNNVIWVRGMSTVDRVSRYDTLTHSFATLPLRALPDGMQELPFVRNYTDLYSSREWRVERHTLWQADTLNPGVLTRMPANDARRCGKWFAYTGTVATDAGLLDNTIHTLLLDSRGILWVGSANNGLFFADTRRQGYRRIVCRPDVLVRACLKDGEGNLWMGMNDRELVVWGREHLQTVSYPMTDSVEGRRIRVLHESPDGSLWLGTRDGLYLKGRGAAVFTDVMRGEAVYALCEVNRQLWVGTLGGLYRLTSEGRGLRMELVDSTIRDIRDMDEANGCLWIATEHGLYQFFSGKSHRWNEAVCYAVTSDPQAGVWVGTDRGLLRLHPDRRQWDCLGTSRSVKSLICLYDNGICCINIYTDKKTELYTEYNEYIEGAAFHDAATGTLYFGGNRGLDCFSADSLDSRLRTAVPAIWLNEWNCELQEAGGLVSDRRSCCRDCLGMWV